mmetsp:Transcript_39058/g.96838  ORF Transcript_39058/g.96838 Transcript_39058/m.96838 type:complete len:203 (+) Transcript_39058:627-1235(+)
MAPEDESGDPDEEYRDGPPDGLGGGPSVAAPAPAPATAPAPASAPAADDGAPLLPQTTVPEQASPRPPAPARAAVRHEFERTREVTDDALVIRDYRLHGQKGPTLFTKPLLCSAIAAARFKLPAGASCMIDGELRAAKRDELYAELCRLRRTHPALVAAAAARFSTGEGYTTSLPVLEPGLAGYHGPSVAYNGKTYAPLEHP